MRVDVADALGLDLGPLERRPHHLGDADRLGLGRGHVVAVVGGAVAEHLGVDGRAARAGRLELLEHEHARAFAHHEAGAGRVERPRGARRVLVLGGKAAHRGEAGQDQRVDAGLGAAGEDRVGVAAPDRLGALPHRMRAGRAGRDRRVVRPADAERDRELAARRVDEHVRDEVRRDAVGAAVAERVGLLDDSDQAADRRAEDDPDPVRVEAVQARVGERLLGRAEREHDVAVEPAQLLRVREPGRVEVLHLGGDPHRQPVRVEGADPVDPALAGDGRAPGLRRGVPDRRDRSQARDDDSPHVGSLCFRDAAEEASVPADGGRARRGAADRRLAVRAQVGRLPRRAREPRRRAAALVAQRPAAAALLPGARGGRGAPASRVGARRRDHHLARGPARVRPAAAAAPSRGEPDQAALGRDPGGLRRLRPARLEREADPQAAAGEAAARARAESEEVPPLPCHPRREAGREAGSSGSSRPASTA